MSEPVWVYTIKTLKKDGEMKVFEHYDSIIIFYSRIKAWDIAQIHARDLESQGFGDVIEVLIYISD